MQHRTTYNTCAVRMSDIFCRYHICQILLLIQSGGLVEAVEAAVTGLPETCEREGTRRVALAARCILEPPSAETEKLKATLPWSLRPADQRKQSPSTNWIIIISIANVFTMRGSDSRINIPE